MQTQKNASQVITQMQITKSKTYHGLAPSGLVPMNAANRRTSGQLKELPRKKN